MPIDDTLTPEGPSVLEGLMPSAELATQLDITERTLRYWNSHGRGPTPTYLGNRLYFSRATVKQWIAAQERAPRRRRRR